VPRERHDGVDALRIADGVYVVEYQHDRPVQAGQRRSKARYDRGLDRCAR
jgi:hypothetical protein